MDIIEENIIEPALEFYNDSRRLVQKCNKPDAKGKSHSQTIFLIM